MRGSVTSRLAGVAQLVEQLIRNLPIAKLQETARNNSERLIDTYKGI
jgi:hypothetical protein